MRLGSHTRSPAAPVAAGLVLALVVTALVGLATQRSIADPPVPEPPFAAFQYGTNGCIEVGVRPDPPYNQPKPRIAPDDLDTARDPYPAYGYDPADFTVTNGVNACRYNFRNAANEVIGSGYCVQFARGQRSGTGYDPEPWDGSIANAGLVRRVLADNWPVKEAPAVPSTNVTVMNRQRSGVVAMAVHYFTDRIVMPPTYDQSLYNAVANVVNRAIAAGPLEERRDPRPTIDGPVSGLASGLVGPYTVGANVDGDVTVDVTGGEAFLDAAGTQPFASGGTMPPGTQLWVRSSTPGSVRIAASAVVDDPTGTLLVGDPTYRVQSMALTTPLPLLGKAELTVAILALPLTPDVTSQISQHLLWTDREVTDRLVVTGLGAGGTGNLDVTLYGPVPRPDGGCLAVAWTPVASLPVTRTFPTMALVGDQSVVTDPVVLAEPGCYTFGAVLRPASGPPVDHLPGDPAETALAVPPEIIPPWIVTSQVSDPVVNIGARVHDLLTVRGLRGFRRLSISPGLLGPVPPVDGSCADVRWTRLQPRVAVHFDRLTHVPNGKLATPSTRLTQPGCYTFVARTTNRFQTGGLRAIPHGYGHPNEAVHVLAPPSLRTRVSTARAAPGRPFADRVHISGLPDDGSVPATARLYGPFGSTARVDCEPEHRVRTVTWRVRNGWNASPRVRVPEPGVYTWRVATRGNDLASPATHRCGLASETLTVAKAPYPAPAVDTGYSGVLPGYPLHRRRPVTITAPAFGLRAPVRTTGLSAGAMGLPSDVRAVAWLRRSAGYGDKIGTTVVAGHVSDRRDRPGALRHLSRAEPGDVVTVTGAGAPRQYEVTRSLTYSRAGALPQRLFRTTGRHRLVLISCTGRVVSAEGRFHYARYRIVVAVPR